MPGILFVLLLRIGWVVQDSGGAFHFHKVGEDHWNGVFFETGTATDLFLDWDGDGNEDIIVIAQTSLEGGPDGDSPTYQISWISNPVFASIYHQSILPSVSSFGYSSEFSNQKPKITLTDMDRDGDLDVFAYGKFLGRASSYWFERGADQEFVTAHFLDETIRPLGVDFDGDGYEDFAQASEPSDPRTTSNPLIILSRPGVTFETTEYDLNIWFYGYQNFRDIDGDGDFDIISTSTPSSINGLEILSWNENVRGSFGRNREGIPITTEPRIGFRDESVMADIDGDGIQDLLVSSSRYLFHLEWFKGGRESNPPESFHTWIESHDASGHSAAALSDYDGDGSSNWDEFVMGTDPVKIDFDSPSRPQVFLNQGDLYFSFMQREGFTIDSETSDDLQTWEPLMTDPGDAPASDGYLMQTYLLNQDEAKRFFRILIDPPPSRLPAFPLSDLTETAEGRHKKAPTRNRVEALKN